MDHGALAIMIPAFAECLVLVGIHSYLGLHVIKRKVIFVDLALAQIAALGATVGFLFGMDPTSHAAFVFSMAFTFLGAGVFALTRLRKDRVPQEAVIGLVYALAAALAILVIDKSPHGAEHIKDLLTGTILWVKWPEIITSAVAYSLVGIFHFVLRHRFIRITEDPEGAYADGMWVRLWDFLFYLSFGFVITFSVRTAGVLLVFVFLVAPAISAVLISNRWRTQLLIGWAMGTGVTMVALYLSYAMDLPSGPTVVSFYGVVLLVVALIAYVARSDERVQAAGKLGLGLAGTAVVAAGFWLLGTMLGGSSLARDLDRHQALSGSHQNNEHQPGHVHDPTHQHKSGHSEDMEPADPSAQIQRLTARVRARAAGWKDALVAAILNPDLPLLYKEDAIKLLQSEAGQTFGYDSEAEDNAAAAQKMKGWVEAR